LTFDSAKLDRKAKPSNKYGPENRWQSWWISSDFAIFRMFRELQGEIVVSVDVEMIAST